MDPFTHRGRPLKARKWSGQLSPRDSSSPDPLIGTSSLAIKSPSPYVSNNRLKNQPTTNASSESRNTKKATDLRINTASSNRLTPVNRHRSPSSPLFVPAPEEESPLFVPWEGPSSPPFTRSFREALDQAENDSLLTAPGGSVSRSDRKPRAPLSSLLATPPKESQKRLSQLGYGPGDLSAQIAVPARDGAPKFMSPVDVIKRVRREERQKIDARKQRRSLSPLRSKTCHIEEPTVIRKSFSSLKRITPAIRTAYFVDSENDSLPDSDEQQETEENLVKKVKDRQTKRKESPSPKAALRHVPKQRSSSRVTEQPSRPARIQQLTPTERVPQLARKSGYSRATQLAPRLTIKTGGIRKARSRLNLGRDGAQDSSEDHDDSSDDKDDEEVWMNLHSLFDEIHLDDSQDDNSNCHNAESSKTVRENSGDTQRSSNEVPKDTKEQDNWVILGQDTISSKSQPAARKASYGEQRDILDSIAASANSKYRLCIDKSKITGAGWGLFTLDDIPADEEILVKHVFAPALDPDRAACACDNCFVIPDGRDRGGELQPCPNCKSVQYCSQKCVNEAYKRYHWAECIAFQKHVDLPEKQAGWRICLRILIQKHFDENFELSWKQVLMLANNRSKLAPDSSKAVNARMLLLMLRPIFAAIDPSDTYDMVDFILCVFLNQGTILLPNGKDMGAMLDPLLSMVNHDCDPNASWPVCHGGQFSLRSARAIAAGEEIKISYIDQSLPVARRQLCLAANWQFRCSCARCEAGMQLC